MVLSNLSGRTTSEERPSRAEVENEIAEKCFKSIEMCDFLVTSFSLAILSYRRPSVCTPFPTHIFSRPNGPEDKDFAVAEKAMSQIPPLSTYSDSKSNSEVPRELSQLPNESLRLLHWILSLKKEITRVLHPGREFENLLSAAQNPWSSFAVEEHNISRIRPTLILKIVEPDNKNVQAFKSARSNAGSFFAFHGTSAENVHSIIRCGLLNVSGTSLQRNGSIHGEGIYLSTDPSVALNFSKPSDLWEKSLLGSRARFVFLCEVANGPTVLRSSPSDTSSPTHSTQSSGTLGTYVVVKNKDMVTIRYVWVYCERRHSTLASASRGPQATNSSLQKWDVCQIIFAVYVAILVGIAIARYYGYDAKGFARFIAAENLN